MFYSLRGTVHRLASPQVAIDVQGVTYLVTTASPLWEELEDRRETSMIIYTYVREDRLDLFGFQAAEDRLLFTELLNVSGVGPKIALELTSIPRPELSYATEQGDPRLLTHIKGIGAKTAEKLLLDLKAIFLKHPGLWLPAQGADDVFDADALVALVTLGCNRAQAIEELRKLPRDVRRTEDRVEAILRTLSATRPSTTVKQKPTRHVDGRVS